jgi:hypothetical protein
VTELIKEGASIRELAVLRDALTEAFTWILMRGGLEQNPMEPVTFPEPNKVESIRVFATDTLDAAIAECREKHEKRANRPRANMMTEEP